MDIEVAKLLFNILQFLLTGGIGIYVYISNKQRVTRERVEKMGTDIGKKLSDMERDTDERLDDHSGRIARVEESIKHLPTTTDIAQVRDLIARVGGDVRALQSDFSGLRELIKPMQHTINLVNDYLLNRKS